MPSKTDFNVSPYFDDYTEDKKFHRVMYRPAFAVQARELTTQQSILQNQIESFGDHVFKHGAIVIPGQINIDTNYFAVKLTSFNGTLSNYNNNTLTGGTSGVVADVVNFIATDGTDPDTLFVKYRNSGTDNVSDKFTEGETITSGQTAASTAVVSTCVIGSAVHIDAGVYYINGFFVNVDKQTLVLEKYLNNPSYRLGLTIVENFITSTDDTTILDNATGSSNANATGAHRFKIDLTLSKLSLTSTADASFVELARVENGITRNRVDNTQYSHLEDTLARRTFDESGDYAVNNFDLDVREHLSVGNNRGIFAAGAESADGNIATETKLAFGLGQGKAYVKGYEISKIGTTFVDVDKAREFDTASGTVSRFNIGSFVNVKDVFGTPDIGFVSGESEAFKSVRLVDEQHGTRGTVFGTALAHVFDIGRAKSRAFEHNSGSPTTNFLSSTTVTDSVFKHYLFDIEMFVHVNVKGAMSGALTTGDILTGGTSGATGIIESISTAGSGTITGATQADPVVVSMSGGHNFTEGQSITIANAAGMTGINGTHTAKNVTATTLELFEEATATNSTPQALDGTGFSPWTSGGTVVHTTIVLNNISGEFAPGETITAPTNSRTGVVQFDAFGCKGFEQKEFGQTKGISMAGSPTFTANTSLDSTFGGVKKLIGTVSTVSPTESQGSVLIDGTDANGADSGDSIILEDATEPSDIIFAIGLEPPADQSDRLVGSGTTFLTDFRIGDGIEFVDDGGTTTTRIIESISSNTILETSVGLGTATATSKTYKRLRAKLQDADKNVALSRMPYDVVKTLLTTDNASVSDTSFKIRRQFVATLSSSGTATITAGTNEIFSPFTENDYSVSIMTTGSGGTGAAGDVISLSTSDDFTLGGSPTGKTLAINLGSGYNGHKIKILATISASVVSAKTKTDTEDTQTVDTEALATASQINLGKADVHLVASVFMAADFSTAADSDDTDVTDRFELDTGQRDNFYDMGRLVRKNGALAPTGRLLVNFSYFEHGNGNFFSVDSYSGFDYGSIPAYTSDVTGEKFELRDVLDFRPRVDNASTLNSGDKDRTFDGTGASVIETMKINTDVTTDLEFFLAKKGRVYLTSSGLFRVITGAASLEPQFPEELKDSMHLYDVSIPPYTFNTADVKIKAVDNRRFTMRDIGRIQRRVENMEYYTQLSLLESDAKSMQIQDADGFDRFKNGIITDNFTGHGVGEVSSNDYKNSMDIPNGQLRPAFHQNNINLIESDSALTNSDAMTDAIRTTNGYQLTGELITLPYVEEEYLDQPYASTTVNLNEYNTIQFIGQITLTPDNDEWMATETQPELRVDIPDVYDTLTTLASEGVLDLNLGTVWNNWNDTWSGVRTDVGNQTSTSRTWWSGNTLLRNNTTSVDVQERVDRTRTGIRTALVPGGVQTTSFGNRVVSVGFASFIRSKDIGFSVVGMKPLTRIFPFFDGIDISTYVTPTGSSAGAALTTDSNGSATGTFALPSPDVAANPKWRTGTRAFRLTSNSANSLVGDVFTSAETDYIAKGMIQQVQGTVVSSREPRIQRTGTTDSTSIQVAVGNRVVSSSTSAIGRRNPPQPQGGGGRDDSGNPDPLAQGFYIDQEDGMFVTSIDLFFSAKDTALPVTMQVRPMVNGYPSSNVVLPFGEKTLQASEISTSTDATTATRFTFPSPVFVQNATEYCYVLICNTPEYTAYVAQMGQTTLDEGRLISSQPMLTSLFKSQNASTWTAEQNQTLKFKVNRAKFTENTAANLHLVNDEIPTQLLKQNPIEVNATAGSGSTFGTNPAIIKINARNHGLHSTAHNVTIAGVPSGTVNGLASTNVNGTYTAIGNITLDSFTVTAQNSDVATSTGSIGGTAVTITPNIQYDIIQPVVGLVQPAGSSITAAVRTSGGRTLEQSETEFALTTASKQVAVELNNDHYMTSAGAVYSTINETNEMSGSKSLTLKLTFSTPTGQGHVSPLIDTTRLSAHLIQNRINNPISGTTPEFVEETKNTGGSTEAKYQTKPVILTNESTALDIRITANVASTAAVKMYYRLSNADDARNMSFIDWRPFNDDGSSDTPVPATENRYQFKEHKFSASNLTTFTAFQLKITMTGTSSCYPPIIKDLRGIALAV
jgi:hypothetical protein